MTSINTDSYAPNDVTKNYPTFEDLDVDDTSSD